MSKSNADFSAFDFNDSSESSDTPVRNPFISRQISQNHKTSSSASASTASKSSKNKSKNSKKFNKSSSSNNSNNNNQNININNSSNLNNISNNNNNNNNSSSRNNSTKASRKSITKGENLENERKPQEPLKISQKAKKKLQGSQKIMNGIEANSSPAKETEPNLPKLPNDPLDSHSDTDESVESADDERENVMSRNPSSSSLETFNNPKNLTSPLNAAKPMDQDLEEDEEDDQNEEDEEDAHEKSDQELENHQNSENENDPETQFKCQENNSPQQNQAQAFINHNHQNDNHNDHDHENDLDHDHENGNNDQHNIQQHPDDEEDELDDEEFDERSRSPLNPLQLPHEHHSQQDLVNKPPSSPSLNLNSTLNANCMETNSNCGLSNAILENGNSSQHCNDMGRSRSASLSNPATETTSNLNTQNVLNLNNSSNINNHNTNSNFGSSNGMGLSGGRDIDNNGNDNGNGGGGGNGRSGGGGGGGASSVCSFGSTGNNSSTMALSNDRRKYRHQNYSKNIYIGTKNAEKWEIMRSKLRFKNDVEFVAYLLNLADNDKDRLNNLPPLSEATTPTKSFDGNFKLEPNLSVKEFAASENGDSEHQQQQQQSQQVQHQQGQSQQQGPAPGQPGQQPVRRKYKKRVQFNDASNNGFPKAKNAGNGSGKGKGGGGGGKSKSNNNANNTSGSNGNNDMVPEILDCRIAEKIKSELQEKTASKDSVSNALCLKKGDAGYDEEEDDDEDEATEHMTAGTSGTNDTVDGLNRQNGNFRIRVKNKQKQSKVMLPPNPMNTNSLDNDEDEDGLGGGPGGGGGGGNAADYSDNDDENDEELDEEALALEMKREQNFVEEDEDHDVAFRSQQSCKECSISHDFKLCPLRNAIGNITDAVDLAEWIERRNLEALAKLKHDAHRQAKQAHVDDDEDMDENSQMSELETKILITFAEASVPAEFELHNVEPHVNGVFARTDVRAFTKLGPLVGQAMETNEIREGSDMKWIFEICEPGAEKSRLLCCDNPNTSNWLRYIRPAPTSEERNCCLVSIDHQVYFVTCRDIKNGMELLYWSDECNTMWRKKHTDKTTCGGCNLKFEHPLYYRTHCSIFHDPSMSLTIRKYHCKVCGEAVLGKDNIMKHATEKHDGKGAHQCQFCLKFFLRISYLEMHRTYGCSANPNRARPLCDFCGRKFCQPQKLKAHIKRMHSDMADVLRDFQCKLCSKLLGSRAALQRHSKEVHSRNSTVVSCPRCQKLFQNRSNLKIHMLTHSGVRPFKCAEAECSAAFTTKQCLQFHYKKVHNYTQEQMPKIERSVAYTFDAYSGGMKVDFLEQAPRRRRKSLEDQNSMLSSSLHSDAEFSDDNIFEAIKKSGKSIKDLCRNEPNLSLLSSKISSMFGEKTVARKKRKRKEQTPSLMGQEEDDEEERMEQVRRKQNAQLSLVESFLTTTAQRLTAQQQVQQVVAAAAAVSAMAGNASDDSSKMQHMMSNLNSQHMGMGHSGGLVNDDEDEEDDEDQMDTQSMHHSGIPQVQHDNGGYHRMNALGQNLVVSKGSKKWISGDDRQLTRDCASVDRCAMGNAEMVNSALGNSQGTCSLQGSGVGNDIALPSFGEDHSKLLGPNRDFLTRLMNSTNASHGHHPVNHREEEENSSYLDVVESNNNAAAAAAAVASQMSQYHHGGNSGNHPGNQGDNDNGHGGLNAGSNNPDNEPDNNDMQMSSLAHSQSFMNSFYNNARTGAGASSSASMLVEAALNSVGNMIDNESNDLKVPTDNNINTDSPLSSHVDSDSNRFVNSNAGHGINSMDNLENELKMMKNLSNFPMQIPPLPMFQNSAQSMNNCNISPNASTPTNPQSNQNQNDVDVDAGSTPRPQHMGGSAGDSDGFSSSHHRTPPSPQPISPGRDYGMFGGNASGGGTPGGPATAGSTSSANSVGTVGNNISASSPLPALPSHRRNASSVGSTYPEHELISPASSPSIPRYNFNGEMLRHKRSDLENDRRHLSRHNHMSSDEENSMMPHNSSGHDMRMKFGQPQMDLMYSKYDSMAGSNSLKYNSQDMDSPADYRPSSNTGPPSVSGNDMSDLQGLDMSSRANLSSSNYHHNFQIPSSSSSNLPSIGRYHHHIFDILSERDQGQQSQSQQQQHHSSVAAAAAAAVAAQHQQHSEHGNQLSMQQHPSAMHNMLNDPLSEQDHDQATSVDLSRTANYVVSSPPQLPYNHPHHDMLRMASLDLTPNTNMSVGNNRSFLSSQMQHQSRDGLDHHRLLSTVEQHRILAASNAADQHRLLVDPTAHLLMEQNNRLLGSDQSRLLGETAQNRHMARGFGAYHQVTSGNYHPGVRPPVLPSANHHASNPSNYHPFPAYY